jgi:hypothetical protein
MTCQQNTLYLYDGTTEGLRRVHVFDLTSCEYLKTFRWKMPHPQFAKISIKRLFFVGPVLSALLSNGTITMLFDPSLYRYIPSSRAHVVDVELLAAPPLRQSAFYEFTDCFWLESQQRAYVTSSHIWDGSTHVEVFRLE